MPPTQYLGFQWPAWCETDLLLDRAVAAHDQRLCPCGCGFWASETQGDDHDGEFTVDEYVCHAKAALDQAHAASKKPTPGVFLVARPKRDGED